MKFLIFFSLTVLSIELLAEESCSKCTLNPRLDTLSLTHREANGIGYTDGYSSVRAFLSTKQNCNWYPFVDLRGHVFNNGKWAANGGVGVRTYVPKIGSVVGVNAFYDFRETEHTRFHQLGTGFEFFWEKLGFTANGYIPLNRRVHLFKKGFERFQGHNALLFYKYVFDFWGIDASLNYECARTDCFKLNTQLTGYHFNGRFGKNASGGLLKVMADITPHISAEVQGSYDSLFRWILQGQVGLNLRFGRKVEIQNECMSRSSRKALADYLTQPVSRFEIIPTKNKKRTTIAQSSTTGQPLFFVFVDNLRGSSDGSFEHPYKTLLQAQNNSNPGDVIYVFPGDGTSTGMDQGITLKDNQWFVSSLVPIPATSRFGVVEIPPQSSTAPLLTRPALTIVTPANSNFISGFNFQNALNAAFAPGLVSNFAFTNNTLSQMSGIGVFLLNVTGKVIIENNLFTETQGVAAVGATSGVLDMRIENNTLFSDGISDTFTISTNGTELANVIFVNNIIYSGVTGFVVQSSNTSQLNISFIDNQIHNVVQGFDLTAANSSLLNVFMSENLVDASANRGMRFRANGTSQISATLLNNTVKNANTSNGGFSGIDISSQGTASFFTSELLKNNSTALFGASGFLLTNTGGSNQLIVESPNSELSGVKLTNTGTFTTSGTITYVPLQ